MNVSEADAIARRIDDEAAAWVCEREEGLAPARECAFAEWLKADPRHRPALAQAERTLAFFGIMSGVSGPMAARLRGGISQPERRTGRGWLPWAAGLAAVLAVGLTLWQTHSSRRPVEVYYNEGVQPHRLALADGSVVDLNTGSRVEVSFDAHERRLTLREGEAHFQVAHDATRPFTVTAGELTVRAVGTAFNVRLGGKKVDVLVVEGRVAVAEKADSGHPRVEQPPLLGAGDRIQVEELVGAQPKIEKVDATAMRTILAWQDQITDFNGVPLQEIVARVNRCNHTHLVIADQALASRKLGGMIALNQLATFLEMLRQDGDIVIEHRGDEIILRSAR